MTLTVRNLSPEAIAVLDGIINKNESIKTKTKAIEHALIMFAVHAGTIKSLEKAGQQICDQRDELQNQVDDAEQFKSSLKQFLS